MLVLYRCDGESIQIGKSIEVKVLEAVNGKVKIGIDAPHNFLVTRKESNRVNESCNRRDKSNVKITIKKSRRTNTV
jgi:carbon storage regulator